MDLVQQIKQWALANYENGGSWIIETHTDDEIASDFESLADAKRYCRIMHDRESEYRNA
jgi:hypothetical protein